MTASYADMLRPIVLTKVVKQVVASADAILPLMGFQPGGPNENFYGHARSGVYHVYDDSRKVGKGRAPGAPAARSSKQNMKQVPFEYPRMHDSVSLLAEFVHNLAKIDDPAMRDEAGRSMIARQTASLNQKAANWRIALTVGMLRDSLYMYAEGDDWMPTYTSTSANAQINFRVPSGNKTQLNMTDRGGTSVHGASIIDVPWTSPGCDIVTQFGKINVARAAQGVGPVKKVLLNSILWNQILKNEILQAMAGIANPVYQTYQREIGTRPDGSPVHEYIGRFAALPGVDWHITDEGLELWSGSTSAYVWTKHIPDTMAILLGDPLVGDKYEFYQGSEPIAEYAGGPKTVRVGLSSWSVETANPTATEIFVLDNGLPVPHDPYDLCPATVDF